MLKSTTAEVYYFGQIIGATNIVEGDSIFAEAYFESGKEWTPISGNDLIQTQTSSVSHENFACFSHPFELHYQTKNYYSWPKMILKILKLDETNTIDLLSYGTIILPSAPGHHEIEFDTWTLHGNMWQETQSYFLDSRPIMNKSDPIASNLQLRNWLITKPGPRIHLSIEAIMKNFNKADLSRRIEGGEENKFKKLIQGI